MELLLKLLLAHLLGDFFLQPDKWARQKEQKKLGSPFFYFHLLVHSVLLVLLLWGSSMWLGIMLILLTHGLSDYLKVFLQGTKKRMWFFIDQGFHLLIIVLVWLYYSPAFEIIDIEFSNNLLLISTSGLFLVSPTAIIIKHILIPWQPAFNDNSGNKNAGKYIGIIERVLVFVFIIVGQWQAIGFLLAAKSVFRFKDIQREKEVKITEYILLGTFLSFAFAIIVGVVAMKMIK